MDANRFDKLTRAVSQKISRREALKTLAVGLLASTTAFFKLDALLPARAAERKDSPVYLPLVITGGSSYEVAEGPQLEALAAEAGHNEKFVHLQSQLTAADFEDAGQEGLYLRKGREQLRLFMTRYTDPETGDPAYLVHAVNALNQLALYRLVFQVENRVAIGAYFEPDGTERVEVRTFDPPETEFEPQAVAPGPHTGDAPLNEACEICAQSCADSEELRGVSCDMRVIAAAAGGASSYRKLLQSVDDLGDIFMNIYSINGSAGGIWDCLNRESLDCSPQGPMCSQACTVCEEGDADECGFNRECVNGDCREKCGANHDKLCSVLETCRNQECVPLEDTCGVNTYMGTWWYRDRYYAACCPIFPFVNCGGRLDGKWAGCCPANTLCLLSPTGGACCYPGLNC